MEDIIESVKQCIREQIVAKLTPFQTAEGAEFCANQVLDKGFISRMKNLYDFAKERSDKLPSEPQGEGIEGDVLSVKLVPGKGHFQMTIEIPATKNNRIAAATVLNGGVIIYPLDAEEIPVEANDYAQIDIEDYVNAVEQEDDDA